jgi:endonuclease-3
MRKTERYSAIVGWFEENMPVAETELRFQSTFQLLVAVVLSAQCTDKRVNMVTPELFKRFPTPEAMAEATFEELFEYIRSVSYPNSKTRHLIALSQKLVSDFGGEVPSDIESLMTLPGVGRKTANVVASVVYNEPVIAVDTHVFRVSHRLGLSDGKTPLAVETELENHIPVDKRATAHHWLILHGRYVCTAKSPRCTECGLSDWCREYSRNKS